jgi:tRNA nucleotidyltransferase (CCA-adding enzyme)
MQPREFAHADDFVADILTDKHIGKIKVGKNLKKNILHTYEFMQIDDISTKEYLEFLDDFLNPGQHIVR